MNTETIKQTITVERVKTVVPGVLNVRWHEGRKRRTIIVATGAHSAAADTLIANAVEAEYDGPVTVVVPDGAWR